MENNRAATLKEENKFFMFIMSYKINGPRVLYSVDVIQQHYLVTSTFLMIISIISVGEWRKTLLELIYYHS